MRARTHRVPGCRGSRAVQRSHDLTMRRRRRTGVRNQRHEGKAVVARSLRTQQRAYGRNGHPAQRFGAC
jgi:hypothetical protein